MDLDVDDSGFGHGFCQVLVAHTRNQDSCRRRPSPIALQIEGFDLLQHLVDAGTDQIAFLAERERLAAGVLGIRQPRARRFELPRQAGVLFGRFRGLRPQTIDHANEQFDFLLEPIDRLQIHTAGCHCRFRHKNLEMAGELEALEPAT